MVYFMRGLETSLIKIGITSDLNQRVKDVGEKVEVLAAVHLCNKKDIQLEREYHEKFKHLAVFGEWFQDDGSILNMISTLRECGITMNAQEAFDHSEGEIFGREIHQHARQKRTRLWEECRAIFNQEPW